MSTTFEIALMPTGRWRIIQPEAQQRSKATKSIIDAFDRSNAEGVFALLSWKDKLAPSAEWLQHWALDVLARMSHCALEADGLPPVLAAVGMEAHLLSAPPFQGGEYASIELLAEVSDEVQKIVREHMRNHADGAMSYLRELHSSLHTLGDVTFHLAENPRDNKRPFAFMASYTVRLSAAGRVQHLPLGQALKQYKDHRGKANAEGLRHLLEPVHIAAQASPFTRKLLNSGKLFAPQAWDPQEAYAFLQDAPLLENAGVLLRLPNWWKTRSVVKAKAVVGRRNGVGLGASALMDFNVGVAMGDSTLSPADITALMESGNGLVQFKGKWVEVDQDKLKEALKHLENMQRENPDGISLLKAMRLLAGVPDGALANTNKTSWTEHVQAEAGTWLSERLKGLRATEGKPLAEGLNATLRPYQHDGVRWLHGMRELGLGACLADDMGLGKTLQVIALLWHLRNGKNNAGTKVSKVKNKREPSLLIAPASLLPNWRAEADKFAPELRVHIAHPAFDGVEKNIDADLIVVSYAMAARLEWLMERTWNMIVLDEAQAIKNPGTAQTKAVKSLKGDTRIVLTGTPIENRLEDLWSLMDFLNPGLLGATKAFSSYIKTLDPVQDPKAFAPLRRLVGPYILRRLKTDKSIISDLPDKVLMKAHCSLSKKQVSVYQHELKTLEHILKEAEGMERRGAVLASLMRLKQLCNHPDHLAGHGAFTKGESGKFLRLEELADEIAQRQEKMLVFTQFESMTAPLENFLSGIFKRPGLILHGGIPVGKRRGLVEQFQSENGPPFFVLSLKAGGTGLTLTAANHVVHFDRWWNPAVENQATDRAFRIGQKRSVFVHALVCRGTLEERIDAMLEEKSALADEILVGEAPKKLTEMNDAELLQFVRLDLTAATL